MTIVTSFIGLCLLLGVGHLLRMKVRLLQKLYLPSCVIGGLVGLVIIQGLSALAGAIGDPQDMPTAAAWLGRWIQAANSSLSSWTAGWGNLPGFLINVVFACLFLGHPLPKFRTLCGRAGPQLAYGQVVAWGQYVVGIGLFLAVLTRLYPHLPAMFGAIVPVGFEGGHGTAAGMGPVFEELDWANGKDFALASATAGIVSAIVVGMALINWAARTGRTVRPRSTEGLSKDESMGVFPADARPSAGELTVSSHAIESFTLHVVFVGLAVFVGYLIKQLLLGVDGLIGNPQFHRIAGSFPLFPLCMLGGLLVQLIEDRFDKHKLIDPGLTRRIQNSALDFLVVAAIATILIEALYSGLAPLLLIVAAGIVWNVFCVMVLAKRMLPDAWFERSIAEMGQSMGVTATGLLLLRVVDPEYDSPAADAFAAKQLLHEPFMGGGLWTSAAVPLLAVWGGPPVFAIACGAVAFWLLVVFLPRLRRRR